MATNNYFGYGGTQYAAANAAYQHQQTQQAYGVPGATAGATTGASYTPQRNAYDPAYPASTTPVTYSAPAAVGVTYDSTKTYYQQAAPTAVAAAAAAAAATTGQGAVTVGSTSDFQNWQQAGFGTRQTSAAVAAVAAANKVTFCTSYNPVPTTRQLTVPPITSKVQTTNAASAYAASQFTSQSTTTAPNYNYSNSTVSKAATVGTIGQPVKKVVAPYQQKAGQATISMPPTQSAVTSNNGNVAGAYNPSNAVSMPPSAYGTTYPNPGVNSAMYNAASNTVRPKTNHVGQNPAAGGASYQNPYDAALISAATTMYMNQNPRPATKTPNNYKPRPGLGSNGKFKFFRPPKPQQLHYCDACKISCAGPSAYTDHLQGQKHKKKVIAKVVSKTKPEQTKKGTSGGTLPVFTCELCDIECTAADAYAAHLRGAKHTKVVKLHTKLGKPIPPPDPKAAAAIAALSAQEEAAKTKANDVISPTVAPSNAAVPAVRSLPPRINFIAAGASSAAATSTINKLSEKAEEPSVPEENRNESELSLIDDRPAVGSEYIEEEKDASGKLISFNCKLCECKFSDPNAKEMHMKGRKHRLQFKKKVDPKLKVEMKPNNFKHKRNEKWKKQSDKKDLKRKDMRFEHEFKDYFEWCRKPGAPPAALIPQGIRHPLMRAAPRPLMIGPGGRLPIPPQSTQPPMFMMNAPPIPALRKVETFEDRHVLTRHKAIFPSTVELKNIQRSVDQIEKALKLVSDQMLAAAVEESDVKKEEVVEDADEKSNLSENADGDDSINENDRDDAKSDKERSRGAVRELTGVLRVGIIAKGLILTGDTEINLVMLCNGKPTMTLLSKVVSLLPDQLKEVSKETEFTVTAKPSDAAIVISTCPKEENEKTLTVVITLTSTVIREEIMAVSESKPMKEDMNNDVTAAGDGCKVSKEISPDPPDVLSKTKCLEALAALRHAKWFQAKAATQSGFVIIRILRDVCRRVPAWSAFNSWALELLCEKVLSSSNLILSPGEGLRRVFECISSGILLPDGPGLMDPCEKDPVDATACLSAQQREDITTYAQYALRLIAFRQIHKVLGMEPLPPVPKFRSKQTNRKRRRENSAGGRNEEVDGKKDKKDDDDEPEDDQDAGDDVDGQAEEPEKMETDKPATK